MSPTPATARFAALPAPSTGFDDPRRGRAVDREFVALIGAYRDHGGLRRCGDVARSIDANGGHGLSRLARWIVAQDVFVVAWQQEHWLPYFQLDSDTFEPRAGLRPAVDVLRLALDHWAIAHWFIERNALIDQRRPIDLREDPDALLRLARCEFAGAG